MQHAEFWSLIDEARATRDTAKALVKLLSKAPAAEVIEFESWFQAYYDAIRREDLWAAVYTIRAGCSDDSFDYFRAWLVGQGSAALLAAVKDPESLASCVGETDPRDESMLGVARSVYKQLSSDPMPSSPVTHEVPNIDGWPDDRIAPGIRWTDAFLREQFPKLHARYEEPRARNRAPVPTGEIDHTRFWSIIREGRALNSTDPVRGLEQLLIAGTIPDLVGFDRWLQSYNRALLRNDLRAVCRIVLGADDAELFTGFRGWLLAAGEEAVQIAVHDPDALVDLVAGAKPLVRMVSVTRGPCDRAQIYLGAREELDVIPGASTWRTDWPEAGSPYTPELLRERLPRLAATRSEAALTGPYDPTALPAAERESRADTFLLRSRTTDDKTALELLDRAVALSPKALFQRGRIHVRLRNFDAALADFDAAIINTPNAAGVMFERAKVLLTTGQRERALEDARKALALGISDARKWLDEHARVAPPKRVRHPKFGDGKVVAIEGGDQQTLVVEFADGKKKLAARFVEILE